MGAAGIGIGIGRGLQCECGNKMASKKAKKDAFVSREEYETLQSEV